VLGQTYKDIELIVVDDASTDGTQEYLRRMTRSDSRLRYLVNSKQIGAAASRNLAISDSKGFFVTGLDDDDEFLPERIDAFVDYWELLTSRGVNPSCLYAQEKRRCDNVIVSVTRAHGNVSADDLFEDNFIGNQVFAPRSHYIEVGLFDEQLPAWQDRDFFIRLLSRFGRAHLLDMETYLFNHSPRTDRISTQVTTVRAGMEIVLKKHAAGSPRKSQLLFLQLFSGYYGIRPNISDWIRFCRWGFWPVGIFRLLRASFKRFDWNNTTRMSEGDDPSRPVHHVGYPIRDEIT
jgi:glycosyltransferase involved in cell wall biosynthesis